MALVEFRTPDDEPILFDPRDVRSVRGGGGTWKDRVTLVGLSGIEHEVAIGGSVVDLAPQIKKLQDDAATEDQAASE